MSAKKGQSITLPRGLSDTKNGGNAMIRQCANCNWYAEFEGVCCNGDCPRRGDFTDADHSDCPYWEKGK